MNLAVFTFYKQGSDTANKLVFKSLFYKKIKKVSCPTNYDDYLRKIRCFNRVTLLVDTSFALCFIIYPAFS